MRGNRGGEGKQLKGLVKGKGKCLNVYIYSFVYYYFFIFFIIIIITVIIIIIIIVILFITVARLHSRITSLTNEK